MLAGDLAAGRRGGDARGRRRARAVPAHAAARRSRRCWRRPADDIPARSAGSGPRRSSGSSTAPASRRTARAARCALFTRNLADITDRVPEIVEPPCGRSTSTRSSSTARRSRFARTGGPQPFQVTMSRFGTKTVERLRAAPLPFFFDCLHVDGADLVDAPARERLVALAASLPEELRRSARGDRRCRRSRRRFSTTRSRAATRA